MKFARTSSKNRSVKNSKMLLKKDWLLKKQRNAETEVSLDNAEQVSQTVDALETEDPWMKSLFAASQMPLLTALREPMAPPQLKKS